MTHQTSHASRHARVTTLATRRAPLTRLVPVLSLALGVAACAVANSSVSPEKRDELLVRPARRAPARFEPSDRSLRLSDGDTIAGPGCVSPLKDPRNGTEIRFIHSTWYGDYEIPVGRYGSVAGDLLRIECNTGRVMGLVRR
jgi:hypothetical protein